MNNFSRGILLLLFAFLAAAVQGGQSTTGVAGVEVVVKQNPAKRAVTDARGNFALGALSPGSYTLAFRALKAKDTQSSTTSKVTVAESYSVKVEGAKRAVNQSGLTSNKLIAGLDVPIQLEQGATIRGQVLAGATKKMVWIPRELGSNIPGHWAEAGSKEAARYNKAVISQDDMRNYFNVPDPHQEGWGKGH
jgi:hypothetical protein